MTIIIIIIIKLTSHSVENKRKMAREEDAWTVYEKLVDIEQSYHG
jgi:hypothetical protein